MTRPEIRQTAARITAVSGRLGAIENSPALSRTPEDYARLINAAADKVAAQPGKDVTETVTGLENVVAALENTIRHQIYWGFWGRVFLLIAMTMPVAWIVGMAFRDMFG